MLRVSKVSYRFVEVNQEQIFAQSAEVANSVNEQV
jgi:hypothetical protein